MTPNVFNFKFNPIWVRTPPVITQSIMPSLIVNVELILLSPAIFVNLAKDIGGAYEQIKITDQESLFLTLNWL